MAGLDDGGRCLMDEINALFAPPGRGGDKNRGNARNTELHPYYKRPGKGHNHDCCDACGEGGDLICCDCCPASFHFSCHCPPLEEEDIPMGDWICLRCYHKEKSRLTTIKANTPQPSTPENELELDPSIEVVENPTATNSTSSTTRSSRGGRGGRGGNRKQQTVVELSEIEKNKIKMYRLKYDKYLKAKPITNSPFDALIKASQVMNAEQFKLPPELHPNEQLPFSWKWKEERQDDYDTYPKNCYVCGKTSRGMPTVACDFCPLVYHLDCLDPPLCEIPTDRWMCPNHVEQYIDSKLVSSTRLSERLALWQKYARAPINMETVRMEFFRKVRTGKLFQKSKTLKAQRPENMRIKVPPYIKNLYKNPTSGFPLEQQQQLSIEQPLNPIRPSSKDLHEDQEEWLKSVIALQTSIVHEESKKVHKAKKVKKIKSKAKDGSEDSDSTDSECEMECEATDEISVEAQEQISKYLSKKAKSLKKLNPQVRDFLATQRLQQLFSKQPQELNIRARASLIPLDLKKRDHCPLTFRTFKIGQGSTVDLDLSSYGKCQCISNFHASIFFDQYARIFELMNYSEHGTIVDNVIYSGDVSLHSPASKIDSRLKRMAKNSHVQAEDQGCFCPSSIAELNYEKGCEVSAALHHGSYIRFGCLQFVFSILTYDNEIEETKKEEDTFQNDDKTKEDNITEMEMTTTDD